MASSRGYRIALMGLKQSQKEMPVGKERPNNLENVENNINIINHLNLTTASDERHTYMPVDVHATLERFISKRIVWAPSEWTTLISNARVHPRSFEVIPMKYSDFVDWKAISQNLLSNNKLNGGQQFRISQLRIAYFKKGENSINIKYSYSDSAEKMVLPISLASSSKGRRSKKSPKAVDVLYSSSLPISELKLKNLMELCEKRVIPQRFWDEYKSFAAKPDVPDTLAETDNEDEINEEN